MKRRWFQGIFSSLFCCEKATAVANLAELESQDDLALGHGSLLFVDTLRSIFLLDQHSSQSPDGITAVSTLSGVGRWLRLPIAHPSWLRQATWHIDPVAGNDENEGQTDASALKTHGELTRRWGTDHAVLVGGDSPTTPGVKLTTVTLKGNLPPTDPIHLRVTLGPNSLLAYLGTPSVARTETLTAVTAKNRATNTPWAIADSATPFSAADVGKRVRITAGANRGQFAWVAKELPGGFVRMSSFSGPALPGVPDVLIDVAVPSGTVAVGDPYVIENLTEVTVRSIDVDSPFGGSQTNATIGFAHIDFRHTGGTLGAQPNVQGMVIGVFKACRWNGQLTIARGTFRHQYLNCQFEGLGLNLVAPMFRGGLCRGLVAYRGGIAAFDNDFMVQGGNGLLVQGCGALFGTVCVFDSLLDGFRIGTGDALPANATCLPLPGSAEHQLWGAGNQGAGLSLSGGSLLSFQSTTPTVTGAAGDFLLAGDASSRAWDESLGAYTNALANTWSHLAAPISPGPGFGGNAHNVQRNAHIVMR